MESAGVIVERWIKPLTSVDLSLDEMEVPKKIVIKYSHLFESTFLLRFRNGYEIPIVYNVTKGTLVGLSTLYQDFGLKGLEFLIFEFDGCSNLNAYVVGTNLIEIEYPRVVHRMRTKRPRVGLRFVHFVKDEEPLCDELEPPISFKRACPMLRGFEEFVFSNGIKNFAQFNLVLINYEEKWEKTVSFFDDSFVEVFFSGTPLSTGYNLHNPIDIPAEYVQLTTFWRKTEYINVYSGNTVWKL
ncbi:hypothetical protein DCAR_0728110 [Daucus carota subsp. sativus]|uniref:Uncharacterized protein n=1 Tax=Daucus carota subsp. sativus TaxID=79200 RepID=A0A161Y4P0_DAUCS|nr:hypothetical protein DCAR_0728110 [Daucus carota subsp. sativus]